LNLNLGMNHIGDKGLEVIGLGLKKLTKLDSIALDLRWNQIGDEGVKLLASGLEVLNLTSLNLNFLRNEITEKGVNELSNGLLELKPMNVVKLNLLYNPLPNLKNTTLPDVMLKLNLTKYHLVGPWPDNDVQKILNSYYEGKVKSNREFDKESCVASNHDVSSQCWNDCYRRQDEQYSKLSRLFALGNNLLDNNCPMRFFAHKGDLIPGVNTPW
jgi:hypothetical protein